MCYSVCWSLEDRVGWLSFGVSKVSIVAVFSLIHSAKHHRRQLRWPRLTCLGRNLYCHCLDHAYVNEIHKLLTRRITISHYVLISTRWLSTIRLKRLAWHKSTYQHKTSSLMHSKVAMNKTIVNDGYRNRERTALLLIHHRLINLNFQTLLMNIHRDKSYVCVETTERM